MTHRIVFEENEERLKVVLPLQKEWGFWLIYTILLLVWLGLTAAALRQFLAIVWSGYYGFQGWYLFAYFVILLIIFAIWVWGGNRFIWRPWQYYTANREILFFYPDKLIVRRPLSLLGITEGYDWRYVSPFRFDPQENSLVFDYGTHRIPIGRTLPAGEAQALLHQLNQRFFPHHQEEADDE